MRAIPLGRRSVVAVVDDADYEEVRRFRWYLNDGGYARRFLESGRGHLTMHRHLLGLGMGTVVDHIDGDRLNNCRWNLRVVDARQNAQNRRRRSDNSTPYKGVGPTKDQGGWRARIMLGGASIYLGQFDTPIEAAMAYDRAAREHFGAFAAVNFPNDGERSALTAA